MLDHTSKASVDARVTHSDFELSVNFQDKRIEGWAEMQVQLNSKSAKELVLDTGAGLTIHSAALIMPEGEQPLQFVFGEPHKVLGTALKISLPEGLSEPVRVGVRFTTPPSSSAVQWLEPSQTAGGVHPYLFTQCQAIHARALVPCQDTPSAKMSYTAAVRVPKPLTALMSAVPEDNPESRGLRHLGDSPSESQVFYFTQKVPIPPYLLALAVGELEARELSPRSRVWSEPSMVDAGAYEFADTAKYLEAGESIAGPYVWGRYDLLLLPPSFPYGGMENPCLTFVTPTLLAGDRSLTNVIAHEIAHSWTGNLVTNSTWEHFWLNEGFTVLLERKIMRKLHGEPTFQFHASNGSVFLSEDIARFGENHPYTRLVPDLSGGTDPDDVFSKVPYEKGFYFLYYLQTLVGGHEAFDAFFRAYLKEYQFKTVTSEGFREFFMKYFHDNPAVQQVDWDTWYYAPGNPPVTHSYDTSLSEQAYALAMKWHTADVMGIGRAPDGVSKKDIEGWSSDQIVAFLEKLGQYRSAQPMHADNTRRLVELYGLLDTKNAEIRSAFFKLALAAEDQTVLPHVLDMLATQGRMKYLRPLFRALFKSKMGKDAAIEAFKQNEDSYHPIAKKMVAADLGL